MIVTTVLLTMIWYMLWGFIFIIPLAFLIFFDVLDGAFFACVLQSDRTINDSDVEQIHTGCVVPLHGSHRHDLFHGILEMGDDQKARLRTGSTSTPPSTPPPRRRISNSERD